MTLTYGERKAVELLDIGVSYEMGTYSTIFGRPVPVGLMAAASPKASGERT